MTFLKLLIQQRVLVSKYLAPTSRVSLKTCIKITLASSPREPVKKERMAKVNKMEKQVNNLEKHVGKGSKVRFNIRNTNKVFLGFRILYIA